MHGDPDPLLRTSAGRATAARIKDSRLMIWPGVGHDIPAPLWPTVVSAVPLGIDAAIWLGWAVAATAWKVTAASQRRFGRR
ncbi:hypothetical protein [Pedococcus sp. KACC 23699]|uniref:hypothetical protein n=1 Tax=Pedococcus sp. KACC 23699 TaxID=3149228 RepID=UPI003877940D